ncbi:gliding motility-associated ABC transporter substrate-binding protein GldG [Thermaurantimonas aggregans]|uniref:gliding motility-associated ABC transporter substrate-binding protein GldG n=1 Tax=Thermaurantimonas aggregans TaxID=2173829 RepID=UPI0023F3D85C|nr:gliding motility-associated ABC transporter substrate-binding protein GldG [Thermaurantimonas aggregans]MCX8149181.1 gliding motility-associated ABC transporter substrate-binding protein GldG [Thermaurantimonas aggregans]
MTNKVKKLYVWYGSLLAAVIVVYVLVQYAGVIRLDLTAEKRYSLSPVTKELLTEVKEPMIFTLYLDGELPSGFRKLQREVRQVLQEFRAYNRNILFKIEDPAAVGDKKAVRDFQEQLEFKGLSPVQVEVNEGNQVQFLQLFPGIIATYGEKESAIQLLSTHINTTPENQINIAIQNLEYNLTNAIRKLVRKFSPTIAFLEGHDELLPGRVADISRALSEHYTVSRFNIRQFEKDSATGEVSILRQMQRLDNYKCLVIAKPQKPFTDLDLFLIDQFIMNGGKVVWLIDAVAADMDSLSRASEFMAYPILDELRLGNLFFRYGFRINTNLVQDRKAAWVSDMRSVRRWIYFPLIDPLVFHPITKDLNSIKLEFASTIDTVIAPGVKKTPLLKTSDATRTVATPHIVRLAHLYNYPGTEPYPKRFLTVGLLLEGTFTSYFKNQIVPKESGRQIPFREESVPTQQVVIADGDVIKNQLNIVNPNIQKGAPLPLGFDQFTGTQYGNRDLMLNIFDYLLDDKGLIALRNREFKLRLLKMSRVYEEMWLWRIINVALPVVLVVIAGVVYTQIRKKMYV